MQTQQRQHLEDSESSQEQQERANFETAAGKFASSIEEEASIAQQTTQKGDNICAACQKPIRERYLLVALDKQWHEDCLKCACCDCRLGEVGSSLFTQADKILCRRDFLRIFGQAGHCAACKKSIPPYELVMRANENAYHMDCFACQQCQYRFCVGDRFHLNKAHRIICILCHSEQQQQQRVQYHAPEAELAQSNLEQEHHESRGGPETAFSFGPNPLVPPTTPKLAPGSTPAQQLSPKQKQPEKEELRAAS